MTPTTPNATHLHRIQRVYGRLIDTLSPYDGRFWKNINETERERLWTAVSDAMDYLSGTDHWQLCPQDITLRGKTGTEYINIQGLCDMKQRADNLIRALNEVETMPEYHAYIEAVESFRQARNAFEDACTNRGIDPTAHQQITPVVSFSA